MLYKLKLHKMKKLLAGFIIFCLITTISHQSSYAQDDPPKLKYMVWELQLSPIQMERALKAVKAQNTFFKEQKFPFGNFNQTTNEGYYWYSVEFSDYADIDKIQATVKELWKNNSDKQKELQKNFDDTYYQIGRFILEMQPELSSIPENSDRFSGSEHRVVSRFHVKPGKEKEFTEQTKKYVELRKKHGVSERFITYTAEFGPDLNIFYFIDELGESPAEHFTKNENFWKKAGTDGEELWKAVAPLLNKTEYFHTTAHFDINYIPSE